jgi:tRNA A-37 threonylcarbamoyl transferase component Bud32
MTPSPDDLAAYRAGRLGLLRFEEVDRWLATQPPEEQARILEGSDAVAAAMPGMAPPERLAGAFAADNPGPRRFRVGERLGAGGMGIVETARDEVLGREVALKRCRPRRPDESMASWAARLRAFKREAAITAQLEHPAIVPVHDVGTGPNGEPAFLMKRLEGEPLSALIARRRAGEALDVARVAELVLRIAEAIGFAHRKGIVHRDLKPDNVIVGALGAVHVIDWGLAAVAAARASDPLPPTGTPAAAAAADTPTSQTTGTYRIGTPDWMAPEQVIAVAPDPRMDVFALGGLLMALLTGYGPRDRPSAEGVNPRVSVNLAPLAARGLPRGLVAVARRCLAIDRAQRYLDGSAVADELRRWQRAGLTQAERPSALTRLVTRVSRSPRLAAATIGVLVAAAALGAAATTQRLHARQRLVDEVTELSARTDLRDMDSVHAAAAQLAVLLRDGDAPMEAREFHARLTAAQDIFTAQRLLAERRARLRGLQDKYRLKGPWPDEERELLAALGGAGYLRGDAAGDQARLRGDPLAPDVLAALVQLQRTRLLNAAAAELAAIPRLIAAAGPTAAWRALGAVLEQTTVVEHDLVLCHCPESETALGEAATADLMLATYGPDPRLVRVAWERWHEDSAAFWPRIMTARDRIIRGDWRAAERNALVALGSEPDSLWPHLILAYVALADGDWASLLRESDAGITENPAHLELVVLKAVALARLGRGEQAQNLVDNSNQAGHLRFHLTHQGEHPMRRAVDALVAAGVRIPEAPAALTPVVQPAPPPPVAVPAKPPAAAGTK